MERVDSTESDQRPKYSNFSQQTLNSKTQLLAPTCLIILYMLINLVFIPLGVVMRVESDDIIEYSYQYDGDGSVNDSCKISEYNQGLPCEVTIEVDESMSAPIYVYYQLDNYLQNDATYVASYSQDQLQGSTSTSGLDTSCSPLMYNGTLVLNPCGLIANTLFNDIITTSDYEMDETGIAWRSDVADKFIQPDGFVSTECNLSERTCEECLQLLSSSEDYSDCETYTDFNGTQYAFWYPNNAETQYIYETFPEVVSPIEGVKNEHFIVWMRVAGSSTFRKLYGRIEEDIAAGDSITFSITANFLVETFSGKKSLVISTTDSIGGKSSYLGVSYLSIGGTIFFLIFLLSLKLKYVPRISGDVTKLLDLD